MSTSPLIPLTVERLDSIHKRIPRDPREPNVVRWHWRPKGCNCFIMIYPRENKKFYVSIRSTNDKKGFFECSAILKYEQELKDLFFVLTKKELF